MHAKPPAPVEGHDLDVLFTRYRLERDPEALDAVLELARPRLQRIARRYATDPSSAEDLVQNTLIAAVRSADAFQAGRRVLPWLAGILHNRALRARRANERVPDPTRCTPPATPLDPFASAMTRDLEARVGAAIREAPVASRTVLELHLRHGLSPSEIASWLRRSPSTVRTQLRRGLRHLRAQLAATG